MVFLSKLCFLCLNTNKDLKLLFIESSEWILIQKQLKYCLPEIVDSHSEILKYVCSDCTCKLECFYKFKQSCLRNDTYLKSYFQTLTSSDEPYKHFLINLTDIKDENKQQAGSSDQTSTERSDVLRIGQKEDNGTCIEEAVFKSEIPCTDLLAIKESHACYEKENNIVVKEEFLTSKSNADNEFYHEYVTNIKQSVPSVSDVSVSSVEDIEHKDSKYSNSSIENIWIKSEDNEAVGTKKIKENKHFQCATCNKMFMHRSNLAEHKKIHTGIKNFECTICKKKFLQKGNLIRHESIHTGVKNFECSICKKRFIQKHQWIDHERNHTKIKNYECLICNKKFVAKMNLAKHEKIHTGIKNYKCSICNKKFIQKSNLDQHELIHSDVKSYECTICKKKFAQKTYLIQHEKIHKDKNYECPICKKKFTLKVHMNTHTKNLACVKNNEYTIKKWELVQHENIQINNRD